MKGEALAMLATLALAGCLGSGGQSEAESPGPEEVSPALDRYLRLEDCIGLGSRHDYVHGTAPVEGPPQWPPKTDPTDLSGFMFDMHECQRVEWGPFARGPITFIIENHSNYEIPTQCLRETRGTSSYMLSIGLSDPDLVDYFHQRFQLPTYLANVTIDKEVEGGLHEWTWHWGPEEPQSHLTAIGEHSQFYNEKDLWESYFWDNGTAVNALQLKFEDDVDILARSPVGTGRLEPPMALAEQGDHEWLGRTDWYNTPELVGTVKEFQDWECTLAAGSSDDGDNRTAAHPVTPVRIAS